MNILIVILYFFGLFIYKINCQANLISHSWAYNTRYGSNGECACMNDPLTGIYTSHDECLLNYAGEALETCTYTPDGISIEDCKFAISIDINVENNECLIYCERFTRGEKIILKQFAESCRLERYYKSAERAYVEGSCFDQYIYGHQDVPAGFPFAEVSIFSEIANSASHCQQLCQITNGCEYFFWRYMRNPSSQFTDTVNMCYLKNIQMLEGALGVVIPREEPISQIGFNDTYCDSNAPNLCVNEDNLILEWRRGSCLVCNCELTCVYPSPYHISGPRHCGKQFDPCNPRTVEPPPTGPEPIPPEPIPPMCYLNNLNVLSSVTEEGNNLFFFASYNTLLRNEVTSPVEIVYTLSDLISNDINNLDTHSLRIRFETVIYNP